MNPLLPAACKIIYDKEFVEVQNTNKKLINKVSKKEKTLTTFCEFIMNEKVLLSPPPIDISKELIYHLNKCKCCSRHQQRRPDTLMDNYVNYPPSEERLMMMNDENYIVPERCKCNCRHTIRFLNYLHTNENN